MKKANLSAFERSLLINNEQVRTENETLKKRIDRLEQIVTDGMQARITIYNENRNLLQFIEDENLADRYEAWQVIRRMEGK